MVLEALKPLGEDYITHLKELLMRVLLMSSQIKIKEVGPILGVVMILCHMYF